MIAMLRPNAISCGSARTPVFRNAITSIEASTQHSKPAYSGNLLCYTKQLDVVIAPFTGGGSTTMVPMPLGTGHNPLFVFREKQL